MKKIPLAFLSRASELLTTSPEGLSGSRIVQFCNAWAADHGIVTPHAVYPFNAPNKRTALLDNLRAFAPEIQYQMVLDLCDLVGSERQEIKRLRDTLVLSHGDEFSASQIRAPGGNDPYVLEFLGIAGTDENQAPPAPSSGLRVFLCHASEDKPAARHLYKQLKSDGYTPWLDEEDLIPGQDWAVEIPKAVRMSDAVLVCLSHHSIAKTGYVQREIRTALDAAEELPEGSIYIIPVRLQACQVPERLSRWQWVDAFADRGYERLCRALNAVVRRSP
jgi:hypothetical protein